MLELDPTAIRPEKIQAWRKAQRVFDFEKVEQRPGQGAGWPSKSQAGRRFGVTEAQWIYWEKEGVPQGPWSALLNEYLEFYSGYVKSHRWMAEGTLEHAPAPKEWVKGLAYVVGGYPTLADEVGVSVHTVRGWGSRGAPLHSGGGPLVRYLFQEMDLTPKKRLGRTDRKLTASQIHEIRQKVSSGACTQRSLAEAYAVHEALISYIVRDKIYTDL